MKFVLRDENAMEYEKRWGVIPENNEMDKLIPMLCKADIPFDLAIHMGRPQIIYPSLENHVCDAVLHWGSYGREQGLLEIMGLVDEDAGDDVEGWLTAEEVFARISEHYKKNQKNS
jgi:hypothetical protein